jgi:hypothetical protein
VESVVVEHSRAQEVDYLSNSVQQLKLVQAKFFDSQNSLEVSGGDSAGLFFTSRGSSRVAQTMTVGNTGKEVLVPLTSSISFPT